jgi:ribosomal protein L20
MARIKRAQIRKKRIKKLFARSKGFFQGRGAQRRQATEAVIKARTNVYVGRKQRKW